MEKWKSIRGSDDAQVNHMKCDLDVSQRSDVRNLAETFRLLVSTEAIDFPQTPDLEEDGNCKYLTLWKGTRQIIGTAS